MSVKVHIAYASCGNPMLNKIIMNFVQLPQCLHKTACMLDGIALLGMLWL